MTTESKNNSMYYCECCNFQALTQAKLRAHNNTKKHKNAVIAFQSQNQSVSSEEEEDNWNNEYEVTQESNEFDNSKNEQQDNDELKKENDELKEDNEDLRNRNEKLKERNTLLINELSKCRLQRNKLNDSLKKLKSQYETLKSRTNTHTVEKNKYIYNFINSIYIDANGTTTELSSEISETNLIFDLPKLLSLQENISRDISAIICDKLRYCLKNNLIEQ